MLRLRFQRSLRLFSRICFRLRIGAGDSCAGSRTRNGGHSACAVVPHRPDTLRRVAGDRHDRFRVSARMFRSWLFVAIWYRALSGFCGYCNGRLARRPQGIFSASAFCAQIAFLGIFVAAVFSALNFGQFAMVQCSAPIAAIGSVIALDLGPTLCNFHR